MRLEEAASGSPDEAETKAGTFVLGYMGFGFEAFMFMSMRYVQSLCKGIGVYINWVLFTIRRQSCLQAAPRAPCPWHLYPHR